jgi:crotonobetainyl-CoA:carnitine CoA-transferase CaiB-like acyl-CoA transferase
MAPGSTWSRTPLEVSRHAPRFGQHSAEVLREAGYDDRRIAALAADGVTVLDGRD